MPIISRRAALAGLASLSVPAGAAVASVAVPAPRTQKEIADRLRGLMDEVSALLTDYDEGYWTCTIGPKFQGNPMVSMQPAELSPRLRLEQGLIIVESALSAMRPEWEYRRHHDFDLGVAWVTRRHVA